MLTMMFGTEQAEANQIAFMQKLSNPSYRTSYPLDTAYMDSPGILDPQHPIESRPPLASSSGNGSSFGESPNSVSMHSSSHGDNIFTPNPQATHLFSFASTPDAGSMDTSVALNADILASQLMNRQECTNQLSLSPFADFDNSRATLGATVPGIPSPAPSSHSRLPSLRDVQEWTSRASSRLQQNVRGSGDDISDEEVDQLLEEFMALHKETVCTQQDIIGVADTAAMYSNYFRRSSLQGNHSAEDLMGLLETLEQRMREISEMASKRVLEQARKSREVVGACDAFRDRTKELDEEQKLRGQARAEFFRTRYDLSTRLSDQT